jgi:hypothetical protein
LLTAQAQSNSARNHVSSYCHTILPLGPAMSRVFYPERRMLTWEEGAKVLIRPLTSSPLPSLCPPSVTTVMSTPARFVMGTLDQSDWEVRG